MKKWFLYHNDVFEGYAPNRAKARSWCYDIAGKEAVLKYDRKNFICFCNNVCTQNRTAIYKEIEA